MKKAILLASVILAINSSIQAQAMMKDGEYTQAELKAVQAELGARPFGELTLNELAPYWARIRKASQNDRYISSTAAMSMLFPGTGQLRNGDTAQGIGFIALHVGTIAGTIAGWYFLLPADLRFDALDYMTSSRASVRTAWQAHSFQEYLPAIGVAAGGILLDGGIRLWSAVAARNGAKAAVEAGTATLTPMMGPGFFGMSMRF